MTLYRAWIAFLFLFSGCVTYATIENNRFSMAESDGIETVTSSVMEIPGLRECSGIIPSDVHGGCWLINDSGNDARLFHADIYGVSVNPRGTLVRGAVNRDWEDIASDGDGRIFIADTGDNLRRRDDICIYVVKEPAPEERSANVLMRFFVEYPEQPPDGPSVSGHDCEAVCFYEGRLYFFTKSKKGELSAIYSCGLPDTDGDRVILRMNGAFRAGAPVTSADMKGGMLALLTYEGIIIAGFDGEDIIEPVRWEFAPGDFKKCEGICFYRDGIVITNEQRELFFVRAGDIKEET